MLATVGSCVTEIGMRKAIGATNRDICFQFLSEATLISLIGGPARVTFGPGLPSSVRIFTEYLIPISALDVVVAIVVSCSAGILFGAPATFAAGLDPVESMRHE
jgi:putative ABC transport system permease protein